MSSLRIEVSSTTRSTVLASLFIMLLKKLLGLLSSFLSTALMRASFSPFFPIVSDIVMVTSVDVVTVIDSSILMTTIFEA